VFVAGDHDVFGDGTVVVKPTPGHTPGHQVIVVRLAKTGSVMLAGDLYHYPEEVGRDVVPPGEFNKEQTVASRKQVVDFLKAANTQLWIGHDMVRFRSSKKSPEYYD
jgi:glyoxylase-like metal-dependent hydrolase (beta-lactamase superfamily II)